MSSSRIIIVSVLGLAFAGACGTGNRKKNYSAPAKIPETPLDGNSEAAKDPEAINKREVSLVAFKDTVYPVVRAHCATCHAESVSPYFAAPDMAAAHDVIVNNSKVDFIDVAKSRLVARLSPEQHNCFGDCGESAKVMEDAITAWSDKIKAAGASHEGGIEGAVTESLAFQSASGAGNNMPKASIVQAAAMTAVTQPFVLRSDDADGAVTRYLLAPTRNGQVIQANQTGATATATFDVVVAGTYYVWARVKTPSQTAKAFNISIDNGAFAAFTLPVTTNIWAWNVYANNATPVALTLSAGRHTVTLKQREENTRINQLALSPQPSGFDGNIAAASLLHFDLKSITGKNASLSIEASEFDTKSKTILLKNLRITTDAPLVIKDVMPLINGKWNAVHATYRLVDTTVNPPGALVSDSALVMMGDNGFASDELSFTFGEIQ